MASAFSGPASTALFRRLTWEGSVPLEIRVDSKELPANSDRGLDCCYLQAPRVTYLPLLLPDLKRFLLDVVFEHGVQVEESDWWLESDDGAPVRWHWPLGLVYDSQKILQPSTSAVGSLSPLRLTLHLVAPPTEKLLVPGTQEACKQVFMGQLKEADFVRWGSTKRVTGLRKAEQDGMWEGLKDHNFDDYWRVASKIIPTAAPVPTAPQLPSPTSMSTLHATSEPTDKESGYGVRSIPIRMYLPGGPVLQELAPPLISGPNGGNIPHTLGGFLATHLPLLFPAHGGAIIHGIVVPPEAELGWLGACMPGADGWLNILVMLDRRETRL